MWIVIDDGDTFEGTMEQFVDCFGGPLPQECQENWNKLLNLIESKEVYK